MKNKTIFGEIIIISVVVIILVFITYRQFGLASARSRDVERKAGLDSVAKVINLYYSDYGFLPKENEINSLWGKEWRDGDYVYLKQLPKENYLNNKEYCYQVSPDGKIFWLLAQLENKYDIDCKKENWICGNNKYCFRDEYKAEKVK